jgi:hypothetical protein
MVFVNGERSAEKIGFWGVIALSKSFHHVHVVMLVPIL